MPDRTAGVKRKEETMGTRDCAACGGEGTVQDDPEPGVHGPAVDCRDCGGAGVVTEILIAGVAFPIRSVTYGEQPAEPSPAVAVTRGTYALLPVEALRFVVIPTAGSWGWGTSPDEIKGREDDREAAIEAAREAAEDGATVYVWSNLRDIDPAAYVPSAEDLLDDMGERAYHDQPECIQDDPWPDVDEDATAELAKLLEPIEAWARKYARSWWVADGEPEAVPPEEPAP